MHVSLLIKLRIELNSLISYDTNKYANGADPPQDADSVLKTLKGVCMGYATLFHALCRSVWVCVGVDLFLIYLFIYLWLID